MKHVVLTTLLNPSNIHFNGAIRIPPELKNCKTSISVKKNLGVRFLGQKGIFLVDFKRPSSTINALYIVTP
jgi:hypothetical protein